MAGCVDSAEQDCQASKVTEPYVSCIRIHGRPILPPLMTAERRDEMRHYKGMAQLVEIQLQGKKDASKNTLPITVHAEGTPSNCTLALSARSLGVKEPPNPVEKDTSFKCVDTQEILEEFDPFAPSSRFTENNQTKCRTSGSSEDFPTSKTSSSNCSMALTNSTDLYHYMDITGSSIGDGRTTRRSVTPMADWNSPPYHKVNLTGDHQVHTTYEGLNEYLDSILNCSMSASSLPSRTKSDEGATPTNVPLLETLPCDLQIVSLEEEDKRSRSCPVSPIPRDSSNPCLTSCAMSLPGKLVDVTVEPLEHTERPDPGNNVPRLVRSNSYTLDAPSPMLLAHLEAEKKKKTALGNKTDAKPKVATNTKISGGEKQRSGSAAGPVAPKRNGSLLVDTRLKHSPPRKAKSPATSASTPNSFALINKTRLPSSPKSAKSPKMDTSNATTDWIGEPQMHKLFADLQAEHNRQIEQLLTRQRKEQELIRKAILKVSMRQTPTWAQYFRANQSENDEIEARRLVSSESDTPDPIVSPRRDIRKSLSSSFILSEISGDHGNNRHMTLSVPPESVVLTLTEVKRPSSSPALTNLSLAPTSAPPAPASAALLEAINTATDTNGNLTKPNLIDQDTVFSCLSEVLPLADPSNTESALTSALTANENGFINQESPRTRRRAWDSRQAESQSQDPEWLQFTRQSQMHWAASKIQAGVRGYLTRRLLRTERVQGYITVIHDTILCALELQKECARNIEPADLQLHARLIHQLSDACREIHRVFVEVPVAKRMAIIAMDRERLENRSPRTNGPRPLSRATQLALNRKMAQNSQNNSNSVGNTASTTRRKNWANINRGKMSTSSCAQDSCEIVPSCLVRSAPPSNANGSNANGDTQRSVSGGGERSPRKPWR